MFCAAIDIQRCKDFVLMGRSSTSQMNMYDFVLCCVAAGAVLGAAAGSEEAPVGSLPVFKLALRPTYWLVRKVFAGVTTATAAR